MLGTVTSIGGNCQRNCGPAFAGHSRVLRHFESQKLLDIFSMLILKFCVNNKLKQDRVPLLR